MGMTAGTKGVAALAIVMGVLLIAGTALLGVLILRRMEHTMPARGIFSLREPAGTRLIGIADTGHGLALAVTGGGADRVIVLDPVTLRPRAEVTLTSHP